ncbi:MAG: hypothetical protein HZB87_01375 [Desulfatitalea sp.]|nr:hypothetical protein [Desulfatitalea sp.]
MLTVGCSALRVKENTGAGATADDPQAAADGPKEVSPVYYDFGDVLLPGDLKMDKKESFIMNSGGVTSGVMVLKGSLDTTSLVGFFENKMPVDGWRKIGRMTSARSLLVFMKPSRWCVIGMTEGQFGTRVEIWVAPTEGEEEVPAAPKNPKK